MLSPSSGGRGKGGVAGEGERGQRDRDGATLIGCLPSCLDIISMDLCPDFAASSDTWRTVLHFSDGDGISALRSPLSPLSLKPPLAFFCNVWASAYHVSTPDNGWKKESSLFLRWAL